jgi:ribonuclease HII
MLNFEVESKLFQQGFDLVVGIDEVGRGCLAGSLYMVGFVSSSQTQVLPNVNDSKKLSQPKRENIFNQVNSNEYYLCASSNKEIDELGLGPVLRSSLQDIIEYFQNKYPNLKIKYLVDGKFSGEWGRDIEFITKGDSKIYSIAMASIIAKVLRDRYMHEQSINYPNYRFDKNVGYGTAEHIKAINEYGLCSLHRVSFKLK